MASGYDIPIQRNVTLGTDKEMPVLGSESLHSCSVMSKRKLSGKHKEKMTLNLRGFKHRLRNIAKREGRHYHTMASDIVISEILKFERRYKKEDREDLEG